MKYIILLVLIFFMFSCDEQSKDDTKKNELKSSIALTKKIDEGVTVENHLTFFDKNKTWFEQGQLVDDIFVISPELYIKGHPYIGQFAYWTVRGKKSDYMYDIYFYGKPLKDMWTVHYWHATTESIIGCLEREYREFYNGDDSELPDKITPFKYGN